MKNSDTTLFIVGIGSQAGKVCWVKFVPLNKKKQIKNKNFKLKVFFSTSKFTFIIA